MENGKLKMDNERNYQLSTVNSQLAEDIREIISQARSLTRRSVNSLQVISNYLIGMRIVVEEQGGQERAEYGKSVLKELSADLTKEFGRGYSRSNLEYMRKFYLAYAPSLEEKSQTLSGISEMHQIGQTLSAQSQMEKIQTPVRKMDLSTVTQTLSAQLPLSWSHYLFLMGISNLDERKFYEIESANENWSLRELKRQFNSSLYERLALSRDKEGVKKLSEKGQLVEKHYDVIKDPLVLEFLGFAEHHRYSETELETAIIDKLEHFLLELGKGFLFEARQKRFTFDEDHFFVDLVFYNRLLRCYVLIDLKIGELKHQDIGQMQMYVNYFDRYVKIEDEQPTIGIVLCKKKKDSLVEITLPEGANIHATKYQTYLPDKEALKRQLEEAQAEWEATHEDSTAVQDKGGTTNENE
jgi:predicted nuclease of restriction endonuclease-like (RecB) superfamily